VRALTKLTAGDIYLTVCNNITIAQCTHHLGIKIIMTDPSKPVEPRSSGLDYSKITVPISSNTRIQTAPLNPLDYAKFKVGTKLKRRSLSGNGQQAMTAYTLRWWAEDEQRLIVEANSLGITPEELFNRLAGEDGDD
jgi:hypothetical protein